MENNVGTSTILPPNNEVLIGPQKTKKIPRMLIKTFIIVGLALLILSSIGLGAYFVYSAGYKNGQTAKKNEIKSFSPSPIPTQKVNINQSTQSALLDSQENSKGDSSDMEKAIGGEWITYKQANPCFTIQYPAAWLLDKGSSADSDRPTIRPVVNGKIHDSIEISFWKWDWPEKIKFKKIYDLIEDNRSKEDPKAPKLGSDYGDGIFFRNKNNVQVQKVGMIANERISFIADGAVAVIDIRNFSGGYEDLYQDLISRLSDSIQLCN